MSPQGLEDIRDLVAVYYIALVEADVSPYVVNVEVEDMDDLLG